MNKKTPFDIIGEQMKVINKGMRKLGVKHEIPDAERPMSSESFCWNCRKVECSCDDPDDMRDDQDEREREKHGADLDSACIPDYEHNN